MAGSMTYTVTPGAIQTSSATPLTANDCLFVKSGVTRNVGLQAIWATGRGAGLNVASGITYRVELMSASASSGGTGITPQMADPGYQAAKHTAGYSASAVTSGTTPLLLLSIGSGATGPTAYVAPTPAALFILEGNA